MGPMSIPLTLVRMHLDRRSISLTRVRICTALTSIRTTLMWICTRPMRIDLGRPSIGMGLGRIRITPKSIYTRPVHGRIAAEATILFE